MKHKTKLVAFFTASLLFIASVATASFPVKKVNNVNVASEQVVITKSNLDSKVQAQFKSVSKTDKVNANTPSKGGDNEKLITILLWVFLGGVAAHRWYKKKPVGWNILFILTGGGCGIWAIIDLINIIKGDF